MNQNEDVHALDQLLGAAVTVSLRGEAMPIRAYTFGQLPRVLEILGPFLSGLINQGQLDLSGLLERESERAMKLCVLATSRKREWLDTVPADEGLALLAAIAEVNADFFQARLAPAGSDLWRRMKSKFPALQTLPGPSPSAGPASSSS